MPDNIRSFVVPCQGGLVTNMDPLSQSINMPGSSSLMLNMEPSVEGGYRRITGFDNTYGTVSGTGSILGVAVFSKLNDGIFACRTPSAGSNYLHKWNSGTESWDAITTSGSPTMTGVTRVRFSKLNWGTPYLALTDGVNPLAVWDGTTYTQVTSGGVLSAPKFSQDFSNHLFIAGDSSEPQTLTFSAPLDPTDWDPANGAGSINMGFDITAMKAFRNQLFVFGDNQIKKIVGTSFADFQLQDVTKNLGCVAPDTVVEFNGDLLFLGPDGIRPISATDRIGDVELRSLSKPVQLIFNNFYNNEDITRALIIVVRQKSQFRFLFSGVESSGIIGSIRTTSDQNLGFEYSQLLGMGATAGDSGYIGAEEVVIHGDTTGKVYKQEEGNSFNGDPITSVFKTPYLHMDDPIVRKTYYDVYTYLKAEGEVEVDFAVDFDYGDSNILSPADYLFNTTGQAVLYGVGTYDGTGTFDGNPSPLKKTNIQGSGQSISLTFVTTKVQPSHTIQSYVISYGLADRR